MRSPKSANQTEPRTIRGSSVPCGLTGRGAIVEVDEMVVVTAFSMMMPFFIVLVNEVLLEATGLVGFHFVSLKRSAGSRRP